MNSKSILYSLMHQIQTEMLDLDLFAACLCYTILGDNYQLCDADNYSLPREFPSQGESQSTAMS
mgnify:CR=1 FL=1